MVERESGASRLFNILNYVFLAFIGIICLYPFLYVVFASFSDPNQFIKHDFTVLWAPAGFSLEAYKHVFTGELGSGYMNTLIYVVAGTAISMLLTFLGAYVLSRKGYLLKKPLTMVIMFTMYFNGGMIPFYLIVRNLHLTNTRTILVLLGGTSVYNMIIARSFFISTIPRELQEAAEIDGCGTGRFFFSIVMPLSKAITAVIVLYCAVGQWNAYFNALIFISDRDKFPLQIFLREILLTAKTYESADVLSTLSGDDLARMQRMSEVTKYGVIVVSTLPIIALYPFLQKYFVKGVMIGSLKG